MPVSDPLCTRCGNPKEPQRIGKYSYCLKCQYKFGGESYKRKPYRDWSTGKKIKFRCKSVVYQAIKSGRLIKQPCEVCGKSPAEGHHPDYTKPLQVKWLCRIHHLEVHANREKKPKKRRIYISTKRDKKKSRTVTFGGWALLKRLREQWKVEKIP